MRLWNDESRFVIIKGILYRTVGANHCVIGFMSFLTHMSPLRGEINQDLPSDDALIRFNSCVGVIHSLPQTAHNFTHYIKLQALVAGGLVPHQYWAS